VLFCACLVQRLRPGDADVRNLGYGDVVLSAAGDHDRHVRADRAGASAAAQRAAPNDRHKLRTIASDRYVPSVLHIYHIIPQVAVV